MRIRFLIGTQFFIIETDHKNLQFWDKPSLSPKVERWKLYLTQFNCELRHIEGTSNIIADGLSRLMGLKDVHKDLLKLFHGGSSGHGGRDTTVGKLRRAGYNWKNMIEETASYVNSCPICQVTRINNKRSINETFDNSAESEGDSIAMDALGTEMALRIASAYLRCKVHLVSYSSVSSNEGRRVFGFERTGFTPTVKLNHGITDIVTYVTPPASWEINEEMVTQWLESGSRPEKENRNWAARLMLGGREAIASLLQAEPEAEKEESTDQCLPKQINLVPDPSAEQKQTQQLSDLLSQFLAKSCSTNTVLSLSAPVLEKLSYEAVKSWISAYRTFLSQIGRTDLFHPSKSISFQILRTAKAYWEIEQMKPLFSHIGKWEEAAEADPLVWLASFELVIKSKQGVSTSSRIDLSLKVDKDGPLAEEFFETYSDYILLNQMTESSERIIGRICKSVEYVYPKTGERLKAEMQMREESTDFTPDFCLRLALAELATMRKYITDHNKSRESVVTFKTSDQSSNPSPRGPPINPKDPPFNRNSIHKPKDGNHVKWDKRDSGPRLGDKRPKPDSKPTEGDKDPTCYNCGEKGHKSYKCPKKAKLLMLRSQELSLSEPIIKLEINGMVFNAMADTGANQENYCSVRFLNTMVKLGHKATPTSDKGVALADNKTILTCTHVIPLELNLLLEGESRPLQLTLYQLQGIEYDIILGWKDILKYGLLEVLQKLYQPDRSITSIPKLSSIKKGGSKESIESTEAPKVTLLETDTGHVFRPPPTEDDGIDNPEMYPTSPPGDAKFDKIVWHNLEEPIKILVLSKLNEYTSIFSETVRDIPCKMAPYKIIVDRQSPH
jgi:hypothetical protein